MVSTAEARETPTLHGPVAKFRNDKDVVLQKEKYLKVVLSRLGWSSCSAEGWSLQLIVQRFASL